MYKQSLSKVNQAKNQLQELLEHGVIQPSTSPFGSPIIIVPRKYGTWRMCIDYSESKKITQNNRYALPRIDDLLDQLKNSK
jgi:hypothetical protein